MAKPTFMVQTHPWLIKYFASRHPLHLLLMILPLVWWLLKLALASALTGFAWGVMLGLGVVWWSFMEYAIHRWAYHSKYPTKWLHAFMGSFHLYHHVDMSDRRVYNAGFLMVYLIAPVALAPVWLLTFDSALTGAFGLGILAAYYGYEWVHYLLHYRVYPSGYLGWIQRYHFFHHERQPNKNFGNTTALWDLLLGTHDPAYKTFKLSAKAEATMITSQEESALAKQHA